MLPQNLRDGAGRENVQAGTWRKVLEDSHGSAHGEGTCWSLWNPDETEQRNEAWSLLSSYGECVSQGCEKAEDPHVHA